MRMLLVAVTSLPRKAQTLCRRILCFKYFSVFPVFQGVGQLNFFPMRTRKRSCRRLQALKLQ